MKTKYMITLVLYYLKNNKNVWPRAASNWGSLGYDTDVISIAPQSYTTKQKS